MIMNEYISIKGARANNLKNVDVEIPRGELVVISGVSGSGKSSLAFDTLYAEGQRRFAESLSSFARQFLGVMSKPPVDKIEGIPPAIAIQQRTSSANPRSTVGTTTEIYDYLRILFTKIGRTYSPVSGMEVKKDTVEDVLEYIRSLKEGIAFLVCPIPEYIKENAVEKLLELKSGGVTRLYINGKAQRIDAVISNITENDTPHILIDRFMLPVSDDNDNLGRIRDSIKSAFESGGGHLSVILDETVRNFSNAFEQDGIVFSEPSELLFSYNNPLGACPHCNGSGFQEGIDEALVIPNPSLSVYEGAIACWRGEIMGTYLQDFLNAAPALCFPIHRPYAALSDEQKKILWEGNADFTGILPFFKWVEAQRYKIQYKYMLARYSGRTTCRECGGGRLRKEARYVKINGKDIVELMEMPVNRLCEFFEQLPEKLDAYSKEIAARAIKEITSRLEYINKVGLGYLTLSRKSSTLSGGESQRINLVSSLGSSLVGSLYILDEPSIGLHPSDTQKLISVLKDLRSLDNTVVVVEHDREIILCADRLIDLGPMAGVHGGQVVFNGPLKEGLERAELLKKANTLAEGRLTEYESIEEGLERAELLKKANASAKGEFTEHGSMKEGSVQSTGSLTLDYLGGLKKLSIKKQARKWNRSIQITGCMENNLKSINVTIPLAVFTVVTGVSGSGKSSLVGDTLHPALTRHFGGMVNHVGAYKELKGDLEAIKAVEFIDQSPIGKSSRSNPVTYLKIYDDIRRLFSEQPYARMNGYGHSHFSFNIDGGRCPQCLGEGFITIPMQFMADVSVVCEECAGKRFKKDILEVRYRNLNISDVLDLSVLEAIDFFGADKANSLSQRIAAKLRILDSVGLGYVKLGQSNSSLSGGENQRIKLAQFLGKDYNSPTLFIFDEPTTGLHIHDISKLLKAFDALVDRGHTIVVVEHNTDVIRYADWAIDLGPGGGDKGGNVVFTGTPAQLAEQSNWKEYLK